MGKFLALAALSLIGFTSFAETKVAGGSCKLENSGEIIDLVNVDSSQHYGMFAEGFSKEGFRVYLSENFADSVDINIQAVTGAGYSIVPLSSSGRTTVKTGIVVPRAGAPGEWLSCDLMITHKAPRPIF